MENIRNSAIGKAARSIRNSLGYDGGDDNYFERISSFKKRYQETEKRAIGEFTRKYSMDIPERPLSPQVKPAVESWNLDSLYTEVLTCLSPITDSEDGPKSESLLTFLQKTFHIDSKTHDQVLASVQAQKSNYVLNVEVVKADGLTGKDVNGLSDPFCKLYISPCEKQYTAIENATLSPIWNEHFSFLVQSIENDCLHIEVWDYDPIETVTEKVLKINQVQSARGLRNLFTEIAIAAAAAGRQKNQFLASVKIPLNEIPSDGWEKWFCLESAHRHRKKGEIFLRMILGAKKDKNVVLKEYRHVTYLLLAHELSENESKGTCSWDGEFSDHSQYILKQLKLQGGLCPVEVLLAQWQVYIRVHSELPLNAKIFPLILNSILEYLNVEDFETPEMEIFWVTSKILIDSFASFLSNNFQYFLVESAAIFQVQNMIRTVLLLKEYLSTNPRIGAILSEQIISTDITNAISAGAEIMFYTIKSGSDVSRNEVDMAIKIGQQLIADLQKRFELLDSDFKELLDIHYFDIVYRVYDKKYADLVEPLAPKVCSQFESTGSKDSRRLSQDVGGRTVGANVLELYMAVKNFASLSLNMKSSADLRIQGHFYPWFHCAVLYWLNVTSWEAQRQIDRAVQLDNLGPLSTNDEKKCITSSVVDIMLIFDRILEFWNQLSLTEMPESNSFVLKIFQDLCNLTVHYARKLTKKVEHLEKTRTKTFLLCHEFCYAINNIERVIHHAKSIGEKMELSVDEQADHKVSKSDDVPLTFTVTGSLNTIYNDALKQAYDGISASLELQMEPCIDRVLTQDVDSNTGHDTCEYLTDNLTKLKKQLTSSNFEKLIEIVWKVVSKELESLADRTLKKPSPKRPLQRINSVFEKVTKVFYPDGTADPETVPKYQNEHVEQIKDILSLFKSSTSDLILKYVQGRTRQQNAIDKNNSTMGVLAFRSAFYQDEGLLRVEIVSCKDLKAGDMNGLSDPYVKLMLVPQEVFPKAVCKTKVQFKTLCPEFREVFSIPLTPEQITSHGVMHFAIKDYDRMSKDDFLGEAFLPLESTRFFEHLRTTATVKLEELPQIHLPLTLPDEKVSRILQVLECRQDDEKAIKFARKERTKQI